MNLNTDSWKEFYISDCEQHSGLFKIENCKCGCAGDLEDGNDINYIGAKKNENGIMKKVVRDERLVSKGNGIIFICDGEGSVGYTNYIQEDFIGSTTLSVGYNENLNSINALFIVAVLDKEKYKFSYGRKYRAHINEIKVKLPATIEGTPDWILMEQYIKSLRYKPLTTNNSPSKPVILDVSLWKPYKVREIFTIQNGVGITKEEIECNQGDFIAVQSGEENNACIGKIDKDYCIRMGYTYTDEPCLTVARSGSAGFVSYQPFGCVVGDSAKILLLKDVEHKNSYVFLFLKTILMANKYKYTYGRKVTEDKYLSEIIMLPTTEDNKPDYAFMENYIKSLPYGDRL